MSETQIDRIAQAMLYEGYILYPYRRSVKNEQRWTFGGIFPPGYPGESCETQTQLLLRGGNPSRLAIKLRFLQAFDKENSAGGTWQEAVERVVSMEDLPLDHLVQTPRGLGFHFAPVDGLIEVSADAQGGDLFRIIVKISNVTHADVRSASRSEASKRALLSAHVAATVADGQFISLIDPPPQYGDVAKGCKNDRLWPVLVGERSAANTVLSAPIILSDYPEIATESPGDLFDGTEIDEILSLRILTLTDAEKEAVGAIYARARALLDRTERLAPEQLLGMHGRLRPARESDHE